MGFKMKRPTGTAESLIAGQLSAFSVNEPVAGGMAHFASAAKLAATEEDAAPEQARMPDQLSILSPLPVYVVQSVSEPVLAAIESAELVSWRYPLADSEGGIVGQADVLETELSKPGDASPQGFESILMGLFGPALEMALVVAEQQFEGAKEDLEIQILEAPQMRQSFLLCKGASSQHMLPYFAPEHLENLSKVLAEMRFSDLEEIADNSFEEAAAKAWEVPEAMAM